MTQNKKSTHVKNAENVGNKSLTDDSKEIEDILHRTTVEPIETEKKKRGRGRPKGSKAKAKKPKPIYMKKNYTDNAMAKAFNGMICVVLNKTFLAKATEKIQPEEIEIGEAVCYLFDYYVGLFMHPAMVLIAAFIGLGVAVYNKTQTIPKEKEEEKQDKKAGRQI